MRFILRIAVTAGAIALGAAAAVGIGTSRWKRATAHAVEKLDAFPGSQPAFTLAQIAHVPDPVARYFRFALTPGQPLIRTARLEQTGTMRSDADKPWSPFAAVEHFSVRPPGFVWDASAPLAPLVSVHARDSYLRGEGASKATIAGVIPAGSLRNSPEAASGSLLRYLAEAAWLPTALLPSDRLTWTAIDDDTARATLTDGTTTVSADIRFGARGEIAGISAMRHRAVNGAFVLTPWAGRYLDYACVHKMMIPMAAEVGWAVAGVPAAYWRGRITVVDYGFEHVTSAQAAATHQPLSASGS